MKSSAGEMPDYKTPPVIEVVCGVLFQPISGLLAAHLGQLWEKYKPEYSQCREVAPLALAVERFDGLPASINFDVAEIPPLPRVWFVRPDERGIIQVQRDRFHHNWKKAKPEDEYPRYQKVIAMFEEHLGKFQTFLKENSIGAVDPFQCEMTYVNHIPQGQGWENLSEIGKVFPDFSLPPIGERFLPQPETVNWRTSFRLPQKMGRLHSRIQTAKSQQTGQQLLLLNLTVRGFPHDKSSESIHAWFDLAREWIVRGFADLTGEEVQRKTWLRTN